MNDKNKHSRMTPITYDYPSCGYVYAEFIVYCNFDNIKNINNITPSYKQVKGDIIENSLGRKRIANLDLWKLSSENKIKSRDARNHIDYILKKIYPNKEVIIQLQEYHKMFISCVWFSSGDTGGPAIWPEQMKLLSDLNLELSFSFYPYEW